MSEKTVHIALEGDGMRLAGTTGSGHRVVMDDADGGQGPSPSELVPVALAGCTAMDVISILRKKRQEVTRYEVEATGQQREGGHPAVFTRIDVLHIVEGPRVDPEAVRRSIELSATRYCAVGATLSTGVTEIHHAFLLRTDAGEQRGEVVVTGPLQESETTRAATAGSTSA